MIGEDGGVEDQGTVEKDKNKDLPVYLYKKSHRLNDKGSKRMPGHGERRFLKRLGRNIILLIMAEDVYC